MTTPPEQRVRARRLVEAALERKAENVVALDVRELTSFADTFVLASGTSDRHVRAVADSVLEASRSTDASPLGVEGYEEGRWVLIDLNDAVVHIFLPEVREHYDLDRLWGDAAVIELSGDTDEERERVP